MSRGGLRAGTGRKGNSGTPLCERTDIRLNSASTSAAFNTHISFIQAANNDTLSKVLVIQETPINPPLFLGKVAAGRPFFVEADVESYLDLNDYLVSRPASTFFMQVSGNSMMHAGISDGDILIVDRSLEAKNNSIVIAILNSELTIERLIIKKGKYYLRSEDNACDLIEITDEMDFYTWGVVTTVIHQFVKV